MKKYKYLEHTADIKFQAFGKTLEEVFENSALAMFNSMSEDKIKTEEKKEIEVEGKDLESLMYNFLEELLFLFDSEGFFLSKVKKIKIKEEKEKYFLESLVLGGNVEKDEIEIHIDIKAVTYNDMFIKFDEKKKVWISQVVVDV